MKIEEAMDALNYFKKRKEMHLDDLIQKRENVAIAALEKQIVHEPTKKLGDWIDAPRCSKCDRLIKGGYLHVYCPICGQKYREVDE